ncbi:putative prophage PSSB64-02, Orf63 [Pseudomonas coronafaciens pv. atropurpurea]|uniref:hypothetical protein n=1 Tax=Pseudomonas coronafaciens TaxID=53409 RepID=UPI0006E5A32C|nr:hypothetical protein [Pseudomonas coronafaciens]KPW31380.1 putative prophage PSSB64-02, Orf63 [Pseudomonas coronafaciens pv. atropurpurea]RMT58383.1 putative prophage PSSB64-02, Orf63 [Pseudomonas coronafaciens pv. atropurpurea]
MANKAAAQVAPILPRFIRAGDAYGYLGMCRDEFNKTVRPNVREFPIGKQGVGFDRLELDAWADAYVESKAIEKAANQDNNRPRSERHAGATGATSWPKKQSPASRKCRTASGRSTKNTEENEFKKVLALVTGRKPSST